MATQAPAYSYQLWCLTQAQEVSKVARAESHVTGFDNDFVEVRESWGSISGYGSFAGDIALLEMCPKPICIDVDLY